MVVRLRGCEYLHFAFTMSLRAKRSNLIVEIATAPSAPRNDANCYFFTNSEANSQ
jgi:hypothetical protein